MGITCPEDYGAQFSDRQKTKLSPLSHLENLGALMMGLIYSILLVMLGVCRQWRTAPAD